MANTSGRVQFDFNSQRKRPKKRTSETLKEIMDMAKYRSEPEESDISYFDLKDVPFSDMKAFKKKKAQKALLSGKVMNTERKKFRKWRKHDKKIVKDMLTEHLQELYENGDIGFKKAKRIRKEAVKRILNCFYAKD